MQTRILIVNPALRHTQYHAYMSRSLRDAEDWLVTVCFVPRKLAKCALSAHKNGTTRVLASDGEVIMFA
jgi:hypothetical protein